MMLDEHRTPRRFWTDVISTAYYISNRICLRSILHLIPIELRFGRNPSVCHFRPFGWKYFVLKHGNLDKFESHSFDDILLGTPLMPDLTEFITLRLTPLLSHMMWPSTRLHHVLVVSLSVQVTRK
jgi:hypothetical protein